jgi:hypothetical protein
MAEAIGIVGQAVLLLAGLGLVIALVLLLLIGIRACVRVVRSMRRPPYPLLPPTDAYIPTTFDQLRRN